MENEYINDATKLVVGDILVANNNLLGSINYMYLRVESFVKESGNPRVSVLQSTLVSRDDNIGDCTHVTVPSNVVDDRYKIKALHTDGVGNYKYDKSYYVWEKYDPKKTYTSIHYYN